MSPLWAWWFSEAILLAHFPATAAAVQSLSSKSTTTPFAGDSVPTLVLATVGSMGSSSGKKSSRDVRWCCRCFRWLFGDLLGFS